MHKHLPQRILSLFSVSYSRSLLTPFQTLIWFLYFFVCSTAEGKLWNAAALHILDSTLNRWAAVATTVTKASSAHTRPGLVQASDPLAAQHSQGFLPAALHQSEADHSLVQPHTPSKEPHSVSVVFAFSASTEWADQSGRGIERESDPPGRFPNSSQSGCFWHCSLASRSFSLCYQSASAGPFNGSWLICDFTQQRVLSPHQTGQWNQSQDQLSFVLHHQENWSFYKSSFGGNLIVLSNHS